MEIGSVQNAGPKSLNYHLNQTEKDLFIAKIAMRKEETIIRAIEITEATDKCFMEIGSVQNAGPKSLNYHLNRMETNRFFAEIAIEKECKIVQEDFKIYYQLNIFRDYKNCVIKHSFCFIYYRLLFNNVFSISHPKNFKE